jgi:hypothetical protein
MQRDQTNVAFRFCERTYRKCTFRGAIGNDGWQSDGRANSGPPPRLITVLGFLNQDITEIEGLARFHCEISADFDSRLFSA